MTRETDVLYIIRTQINRRHATPYHRVENALPLYEIEKARARERQLSGGFEDLGEKFRTGRATEILGDLIGLSDRTVEKALYIVAHGSEEMKERLRRDYKYRINNAWAHLKGENRPDPPPLPEGVYDIIYADPPWKYGYGGSMRGKADMHYPTMATEEIAGLPIGGNVADDAMLFLWTTNPMLEDALEVVEAWGFDYKTNWVWVKPHFGTGFYSRSQHELLLLCRRGKVPLPADGDRFPSVITAPPTRHSEKPRVVYDRIERMYPNHKYLELFARTTRPGWASWGDEVE